MKYHFTVPAGTPEYQRAWRQRLKADAARAAASFVRSPLPSLHVMDPNFTRAFLATSLETGAESVVLVGAPVRPEVRS